MIQLSEFFQCSFVLILKRKCLVGASRVRCGESGTHSTIIYTRWSSRHCELGCDAPVDGAVHVAHCECQGPVAASTVEVLDCMAMQTFRFESYRKREVLHQTVITNNPNTIVRNVADLRFEVHRMWNDIPRASIGHLIHSCRRRVRSHETCWV